MLGKNIIKNLVAFVLAMVGMVVSPEALLQASAALARGPRGMVSFVRDPTAESSPRAIVALVVGLTVGLVVIGYLFPVGMTGYHAINFTATGMTTDEQAIYSVLGIFSIIALMLAIIGIAVKGYD